LCTVSRAGFFTDEVFSAAFSSFFPVREIDLRLLRITFGGSVLQQLDIA